jgi:hypothetical protein
MKDQESAIVEKWLWKMDYCKEKKFPPAQAWAWDLAEAAFNEREKRITLPSQKV